MALPDLSKSADSGSDSTRTFGAIRGALTGGGAGVDSSGRTGPGKTHTVYFDQMQHLNEECPSFQLNTQPIGGMNAVMWVYSAAFVNSSAEYR